MNNRWLRTQVVVSLLAIPFLIAGDCDDDPPTGTNGGGGSAELTLPSSWSNTYRIESYETTRRGEPIVDVGIDVLCAGEPILEAVFPDELADAECEGTISSSGADITCTLVEQIGKDCTRTVEAIFLATRNTSDGTVTGSQTFTETFEGTCIRGAGSTSVVNFEATVLDEDAHGCDANLEDTVNEAWGGTWALSIQELICDTETPVGKPFLEDFLMCPDYPLESLLAPLAARMAPPGFERGGFVIDTWGGFTSTTLDAFFVQQGSKGGCPAAQTIHFQFTRNGDGLAGTLDASFYLFDNNSGKCTELSQSECYDVNGTRTSTDTKGCGIIPRGDLSDATTLR